MLLRKIARPMLGAAFVASGAEAVRSPGGPSAGAGASATPLPATSQTAIQVAGAVQIGAGLALAAGKAPRVASAVLAGTLVPTTFFASDFWNESDPALRTMKQSSFVKNLGLFGGVLISSADTEGKPSLGWRARRKLDRAEHLVDAEESVVAAVAKHRGDAQRMHEIVDRIPTAELKSRAADLADAARARASEAVEAAPGVVENVRQHVQETAADIADRAPAVAAEARDLAVKAGEESVAQARRWRKQLTY
ncbi:DoxX family protein [Gordonia aichiensis]|uniref:DoxX family protein n=1 Tax=Gordonia aichiensis TaxID=36820 RepID=UPI003267DA86